MKKICVTQLQLTTFIKVVGKILSPLFFLCMSKMYEANIFCLKYFQINNYFLQCIFLVTTSRGADEEIIRTTSKGIGRKEESIWKREVSVGRGPESRRAATIARKPLKVRYWIIQNVLPSLQIIHKTRDPRSHSCPPPPVQRGWAIWGQVSPHSVLLCLLL